MSCNQGNRPEPTAAQAAPVSIEAAPEPIEGILTPAIVTVPLAGSLELGSDGQFRYHPRKIHVPPADVFEYTAVE